MRSNIILKIRSLNVWLFTISIKYGRCFANSAVRPCSSHERMFFVYQRLADQSSPRWAEWDIPLSYAHHRSEVSYNASMHDNNNEFYRNFKDTDRYAWWNWIDMSLSMSLETYLQLHSAYAHRTSYYWCCTTLALIPSSEHEFNAFIARVRYVSLSIDLYEQWTWTIEHPPRGLHSKSR